MSNDKNVVGRYVRIFGAYDILGVVGEDLVSADIIGDTHSSIVHALSTQVVQGSMVKIQVWYDNKFGYSKRLLDVIERLDL
jgi:glyceraldehyde 3-phosphate dehydrogenase